LRFIKPATSMVRAFCARRS